MTSDIKASGIIAQPPSRSISNRFFSSSAAPPGVVASPLPPVWAGGVVTVGGSSPGTEKSSSAELEIEVKMRKNSDAIAKPPTKRFLNMDWSSSRLLVLWVDGAEGVRVRTKDRERFFGFFENLNDEPRKSYPRRLASRLA